MIAIKNSFCWTYNPDKFQNINKKITHSPAEMHRLDQALSSTCTSQLPDRCPLSERERERERDRERERKRFPTSIITRQPRRKREPHGTSRFKQSWPLNQVKFNMKRAPWHRLLCCGSIALRQRMSSEVNRPGFFSSPARRRGGKRGVVGYIRRNTGSNNHYVHFMR